MSENKFIPKGLSVQQQDEFWMSYAQELAHKAEELGEVPVGAVVVLNGELIAEGWNQSILNNDPTAHAEIIALQKAGEKIGNYRLIDSTLYVTLEPCPMCAGAMVHARVKRLVFGAFDLKTGAAGSVFNLITNEALNHKLEKTAGIAQQKCATQLSNFFKKRRKAHKLEKNAAKQKS